MKLLLCIGAIFATTSASFPQGTVLFQNYPDMDLVRLASGRPVPAGEDWIAELLAGADPASVVPVATTTFKLSGVFGVGDPPALPLLGFKTWDTGGWIYADLIGDEVVMHWGRSTTILDVKWELAESSTPEGLWANIHEAPSPYVVSRFSGAPRYFRTVAVTLGLTDPTVEATQPGLDVTDDR